MKQSIQLRLGHSLTMTPQLQQAIRLLQLSSMELSAEIQQALESNMMLEMADDENEPAAADSNNGGEHVADAAAPASSPETEPAAESRTEWESEVDRSAPAEASSAEESETDSETAREREIPDDLPVDTAWDDIYDGTPVRTPSGGEADSEWEEQRCAAESLRDHLSWQLNVTPMNESDRAIAVAVIDAINADGYLTATPEEIKETLGPDSSVELDEVVAVIKHIQQFDPPGVAARDLGESLRLQLDQCPPEMPWLAEARKLVNEHLALLAERDFQQLMRRLKLTREELQQVVALIQTLDPRPGTRYSSEAVEYVTPDVYVRKKNGAWLVELNPDLLPNLRINRRYAAMIRRADNSPDNASLRAHLQEARWFIKSLQSRGETLLKVATAIVERQRAFLEHGPEAMKPLVLADIAEALGLHESTISRVTTRKYMHTPRGIYELKYFFSSHVSTAGGGEASSTAIRAVIKKLIDAETPSKPLSDSALAKILTEQGVNVARRTVAKYREAMNIAPSHERKRLT
ncbi:MAG TPA: RNA polymerase factor sigma-54 [Gammaproteobacteria bacterium]|nr:RNA polymerase factor sigma-54 [Gammaproteobacteria bacterium]